MCLLHVAIELTPTYLGDTEGKDISTGRRSIIQRKDKDRKTGRGGGISPSIVLSQYMATTAEQDERHRWS